MRPSRQPFRIAGRSHLIRLPGLLLAAMASGCAMTNAVPPTPASKVTDIAPEAVMEFVPVTRYGRYTLVELAPTAAQHDLLLQVVDVEIPGTLGATVGDALRHLVLRSGYRLCDEQSADLLALPLPAAHYRLGPVLLRDALLTLAGPVWDLQVDDGERKVCFIRSLREAHTPHESNPPQTNNPEETSPQIREVSP
ncbi:PilL N-terminal domain-containing protein [Pseudomonas aeruginosa]|uniref:PFGI-1 class ICE element type IV pilus protein PilL2 n=1 Tax=Pseudomonas paraeruginosa TaxID=2994495 RepID=UPI00249F53AD|nr:PilL N-terminal domain-containing protein [Pseudomonas aeruginosa]MDI3675218.1 PilL N-terminal domain-containing protein [Pseudomonas aeruginosa]MDI3705762.1 PilL N-terminal domain-containing protein [Pseudomonas aeruginosa]MDI3759926.1 PilL N-terminal domain-containing protein [Pseudomonas aeruginosa]MDI3778676.1 PilL N-terminal domain-containing protein [Pseudomonas aeruginosa]